MIVSLSNQIYNYRMDEIIHLQELSVLYCCYVKLQADI